MEEGIKTAFWGIVALLFYCWLVYRQGLQQAAREREEQEAERKLQALRGPSTPESKEKAE